MLFAKVDPALLKTQLEKLDTIRKQQEEAEKAAQLKAQMETTPGTPLEPQKDAITFDDFAKMDIRIGTILTAERLPKSDELLKLEIDTGIDKRTVLSGIAKWYKPEDIIGQQVTILVNLAPRRMMNIESNGMILMSENDKGELSFVSPIKNNQNNGSTVK